MRDITTAANNAASAASVTAIILAELDFSSGFVRAHTGVGNIVFGGNTYLGVGAFGGIDGLGENSNLESDKIKVTLSGVEAANVAIALTEYYQGRPAKFWIAFLDDNMALIADPVLIFQGRMDTMALQIGQQSKIDLTIINRLADWSRPNERRYNNADQQRRFAGDKFFEFVEIQNEKTLYWGRKANA